jgi:hypothetical protein
VLVSAPRDSGPDGQHCQQNNNRSPQEPSSTSLGTGQQCVLPRPLTPDGGPRSLCS